MTTEPQAQTSERERLVASLLDSALEKANDYDCESNVFDEEKAADMLRADAEKIRALEARPLVRELRDLQAKLAACEADAARYRWLTAEPGEGWTYYDYRGGDLPEDFRGHWVLLGPVTDDRSLNAAIDAALAAPQPPRSEAGEDK